MSWHDDAEGHYGAPTRAKRQRTQQRGRVPWKCCAYSKQRAYHRVSKLEGRQGDHTSKIFVVPDL